MKNKHKITLIVAALAVGFLWSGNAKADYWTQHTRSTSGDALPAHFELENMAKSSNGVRFLYGNDRVDMNSESSFVRHLVKYDGTNWSDETSAVETAAGYSDIEFLNMYADQHGNVWMPNRKDPDVALMKYGSDGSWTKITSATIGSQVGIGAGGKLKIKNLFGNRKSDNFMYAVATNDTRLYVLIYTFDDNTWRDSGYTDSPLLDTSNNNQDFWGIYNDVDQSFWFYQYHSSENEFSNPAGGDQGIGLWRYKNSEWTHFNSSTDIGNGEKFKNGLTEAYVDTSGNVWAGTRYGVYKYSAGGDWTHWTKENSKIFTNRVQKVQEDDKGRIWIVSLAVENSNESNNRGGISIYDPSADSWDYYTSYNGEDALDNATNIFMIGSEADEAWMFTGHGEEAMTAGIYALTRDNSHTALYGQVAGATVEKASFDPLKKSKVVSRKVTIWKNYRVQNKNRKWKWTRKRVYSGKTSSWYKQLNLDTGANIKYSIVVQGKKTRTINASSGDPIRVNFN